MTHPTIHYGKCALCRNDAALQESHAIPDATFRRLFSKGSGSAIVLNNDPNQPIYQSQDSWTDRLLCKACEGRLNVQYDTYGDVQKTRSKQAEIRYDEDDRPYTVM